MKTYMIILDGAADRKIKILENKTPLEKAKTPALDYLAQNGEQTMITIIDDAIAPESDSGAMALLSYNPKQYYPGRGTLEGIGTEFIPKGYNYSAFRLNFASYDKKENRFDRRTSRDLKAEELQELAKSISENVNISKYNVEFRMLAFGHHRGIICFYSKEHKLSGNVSNTDPGFKKKAVWGYPIKNYEPKPLECRALDNTKEAKLTAKIINDFCHKHQKYYQIIT